MVLSPVQQHILNYFMLAKVTSLKCILEVFEQVVGSLDLDISPNEAELSREISCINKTIKKLDLEIVQTVDEVSCEKLFILINTANNFVTQKSKFYDDNTSRFFAKIIKECVMSSKGFISEIQCLNLSSELKISKTVLQLGLEKLARDKWLKLEDYGVTLGMRTIVELEQNLKKLYPDNIKNCIFCKLVVVQGCICYDCNIKGHKTCVQKYFSQKHSYSCPKCNKLWDGLPLKSEDLDKDTTTANTSQSSFSSSFSSQVKRRKKNDNL